MTINHKVIGRVNKLLLKAENIYKNCRKYNKFLSTITKQKVTVLRQTRLKQATNV